MKSVFAGIFIVAFWAVSASAQDPAQVYLGDVAINKQDVKLGAKHYSPFLDESYISPIWYTPAS